ncbi:tryptophanyl-tRNA synthetase [Terrimicrobium sacchariphilum]|uniref:Tryptophan--tRNA ligase n=1 Tax=Terrimicrobium sacchariphilum TaxID=690879 RepID=A0A146G8C1_TERSA|nr:tryptophan--tRNA ligase [Terrimicrobium sacchariphilum]GAT33154.1 tryptophanyl-tRNA synthetase [Terrimicrobium sacchariphilum]
MRILSGIQPSGTLHLGNYFGMMRPAIELQDQGEALYFIADYHALTTVRNAADLSKNIRDVAIDFLACGLDPQKACFFRQSHVPAVTELSWILSVLTPMGLLERCHSYKDKLAKGFIPSHGLFAYPVLMAADILIYDSDLVPVGKDQKQHIEVARDLVIKFNEAYGDTLKLPEPSIREEAAVVPGVNGEKMSKSYGNTIGMFEEEKPLRKKIMGLKTDTTPIEAPKPTENSNILALYKLVASGADYDQMVAEFQSGGVGYGTFKQRLFEAIWTYFAPMRERRAEILADPGYVDRVLKEGAEKANALATPVMQRVRKAVGLT